MLLLFPRSHYNTLSSKGDILPQHGKGQSSHVAIRSTRRSNHVRLVLVGTEIHVHVKRTIYEYLYLTVPPLWHEAAGIYVA